MVEISLEDFGRKIQSGRTANGEWLYRIVSQLSKSGTMKIIRKDSGLLSNIATLLEKNLFPIVDKGLQTIFFVRSKEHLFLLQMLFDYHYYKGSAGESRNIRGQAAADEYIARGRGYFISSVARDSVVINELYIPDKFDHEVLSKFAHIHPNTIR